MNPRVTIWFAIVMSTVIYLVLAVQFSTNESMDFEQRYAKDQLVQVLYGVAIATFVAGWFVVPRIVKRDAQQRMVVAPAVFEACALFGLVAAFLRNDWRVYVFPWALAIIGFIREFPRAGATEPPAPM